MVRLYSPYPRRICPIFTLDNFLALKFSKCVPRLCSCGVPSTSSWPRSSLHYPFLIIQVLAQFYPFKIGLTALAKFTPAALPTPTVTLCHYFIYFIAFSIFKSFSVPQGHCLPSLITSDLVHLSQLYLQYLINRYYQEQCLAYSHSLLIFLIN